MGKEVKMEGEGNAYRAHLAFLFPARTNFGPLRHDVFSDGFSETILLLFGFAGPQLYDHMRHGSLLMFMLRSLVASP
jgi:hypothetical protein